MSPFGIAMLDLIYAARSQAGPYTLETFVFVVEQRILELIAADAKMAKKINSIYGEAQMSEFKLYRRKNMAEIRPYVEGEPLTGVAISTVDTVAGSPKVGDMVARNPKDHGDKWLLAKKYFEDNFEEMPIDRTETEANVA